MKKLIISEVISVIVVLGIFLLVFTLLNGWEKVGRERYAAAVLAAFVVVAVALLVAGFATAVAAHHVTAAISVVVAVAAFVAVLVAATIVIVAFTAALVFVVFLAVMAIGVAILGIVRVRVRSLETQEINASKKVIWLSLGAEVVAIFLPIILITFY